MHRTSDCLRRGKSAYYAAMRYLLLASLVPLMGFNFSPTPIKVEWTTGKIQKGRQLEFSHDMRIHPQSGTISLSDRDVGAELDEDYEFCGVMPQQTQGRGRRTQRQRIAQDFVREFVSQEMRERALIRMSLDKLSDKERKEKLEKFGLSEVPSAEELMAVFALRKHADEVDGDYVIRAKSENDQPRRYRIDEILKYFLKQEDNVFLGYEIRLAPIDEIPDLEIVESIVCFRHMLEDRMPTDYWHDSQDEDDNEPMDYYRLKKIHDRISITEAATNDLLSEHIKIN